MFNVNWYKRNTNNHLIEMLNPMFYQSLKLFITEWEMFVKNPTKWMFLLIGFYTLSLLDTFPEPLVITLYVPLKDFTVIGCNQQKYPNLGYPRKNAENRDFCTKGDLKVLYALVMFVKLMLRIVEFYCNVLVLISQVAALKWNDTIYPNLWHPSQKRRKSTLLHEKWSESTLSISDVPETYIDNSWGL